MFLTVTMSLLEGLATTVKLFALTLLFSLPLGLIISFGSMSRFKVLRYPVKLLVWIVRGSPLMIQLLIKTDCLYNHRRLCPQESFPKAFSQAPGLRFSPCRRLARIFHLF